MIGPREAPRGEQYDEQQRRRGKTDDDGGQHESLWQRIGKACDVNRCGGAHDGRSSAPHPAHDENEKVDRVGEEREADDHLEGARPQNEPHAASGEHTNPEGDDQLHQSRTDWCASAMSKRPVAPTTSAKTPRSKKNALGTWRAPSTGSSRCAVCEVRNGWAKSHDPMPVAAARRRPTPIQRIGRMAMRDSAQRVPPAMY